VQSSSEASANTTPAPCGAIPSIARAYSVNLTVVPQAGGAVGYVSIWPAGSPQPIVSTLNDVQGVTVANAAIVPAGTPFGGIGVYNSGPATTDVVIDLNGFFAAPTDLNNNTGLGAGTLASNVNGSDNTASGAGALSNNTGGSYNTASGVNALSGVNGVSNNTGGNYNTAVGYLAGQTLNSAVLSSNNTFLGAGSAGSTATLTNATAIGSNAEVAESNALVLGAISGVNGGTNVNVGIGTTTPAYALHVFDSGTSGNAGIAAISNSVDHNAVYGSNRATSSTGTNGGWFETYSSQGAGLVAENNASGGGVAAFFQGDVTITGNVSKAAGMFKIDHPLDPANKYLSHSFVESPDMMNIYNGNITTNQRGVAVVVLPEYFEALNRDFRYQLTVIGQFARAIVARKIAHNRFVIRTNTPGVEVSWQVTGIRQDAYANSHRIPTEEAKPPQEQGKYLHPELFGGSKGQAIGYHLSSPSTPSGGSALPARALLANPRSVADIPAGTPK